MPATPKAPLGAATTVRKWYIDVNTGTAASPIWVGVFGVKEFKPADSPTWKDTSDFDSEGYKSSLATAFEWGPELKVERKVRLSDSTQYDPGQEALRLTAANIGTANSREIRYYEMEPGGPRIEAYQGYCGVEWSPEGGSMEDTEMVSIKLIGQGKRNAIAHPDNGPAPAPVLSSLAPATAAAAGGALILVNGTGLSAVTTLSVDGTNVFSSDWEVVNGSVIALKAPAKAAGARNVVVTAPSGTSNSLPLTYS